MGILTQIKLASKSQKAKRLSYLLQMLTRSFLPKIIQLHHTNPHFNITKFKPQLCLINHSFFPNHAYPLKQSIQFPFSKQKIIEDLEKLNLELDAKNLSLANSQNLKGKGDQFLQKQQKIIKDFLDLTEQSFSEQLEHELKQKYHVDAEMLLMIIASLQDPIIIKQTLPKIYPFISILDKKQLLLLFELIVAYKPQNLPALSTVAPRPLEGIESMLLLLNEVYEKEEKIVEWAKEVPLYKGKNVCMVGAGLFAVYQKMEQHAKFKNERVFNRCMDRIINLAIDQDAQTQISIAILSLQSQVTSQLGQKFLIGIQKIDYDQVDPLKLQLFFIHLQRTISTKYSEVRSQLSKKNKYKILEESEQGEVIEKEEEEYTPKEGQSSYEQISQIQKFKFLNSIAKTLLIKIIDLNWTKLLKLNLLVEYWKILDTFPDSHPWNSFKNKLLTYTNEKEVIKKMTNLDHDEVLIILETMERLKINKSQLLMRLLTLISQKLGVMSGQQLIRLARVCVTFVRQCEDFLISVRYEIEGRKFIFSEEEIENLNMIFKRVLALFPRPLVK